jgi:2-polyprenyl-3-methyl-5-hydroxy-6-metoxy-1,4-benzoquinol methylase
MTQDYKCRVCGQTRLRRQFKAREMMFGMRDEFLYDECDACGSLQIASLPDGDTLQKYYPSDYYAYVPPSESRRSFKAAFWEWLAIQRNLYLLGRLNPVGAVMQYLRPATADIVLLAAVKARFTDRILDMGCGSAANLLNRMVLLGFKNLLGADPLIAGDTVSHAGVKVIKKDVGQIEEKFDLVMFNHSFEHVPEPRDTLLKARQLLSSGGHCLIRIPTPSSEAFETYGADWVQLDAPRHLVLPSREGMQILARECGFVVEKVVDESTRYQFIASELYTKDVPLLKQGQDPSFLAKFSRKNLKEYDRRAAQLNLNHRGDAAGFILKAVEGTDGKKDSDILSERSLEK